MRAIYHACVADSLKAVEFYSKAFHAEVLCCYVNTAETFVQHAELALNQQSFLSIQDILDTEKSETHLGNTMRFWVTFDDEKSLLETYDILSEGAEVQGEPAPCEWCKLLAAFTDNYGINWLLNVF